MTLPITFRAPKSESDHAFIYSGWLKSFMPGHYDKPHLSHHVPRLIYFKDHRRLIERLLGQATALLAANPADEDQLYGFICSERAGSVPVLHYVYVKQSFRRMGIAKALMSEAGVTKSGLYTHHNNNVRHLMPEGVYHPYLLMQGGL